MLARMQSQMVADQLEKLHSDLSVQLVIVSTTGDRIQNKPLADAGGKGLFTKELEQALLRNEVDFAVHSFKDVPVTMPLVDTSDLVLAAVPEREDPRDVLISLKATRIIDLPTGATVGTSSFRRRAQVLAARPDLQMEDFRGNIDTRIRKLVEGQVDATVLAMAGLKRSGLFDQTKMRSIEINQMIPASAQGALAIQCRRDDKSTLARLEMLNDSDTARCVSLERGLVMKLNGDCHSPIGALAEIENGRVRLKAMVAARDGFPPVVRAEEIASIDECSELVEKVYQTLVKGGALRLLKSAK
jgi:hydroxymethylbilane synthase